MKRKFSKKDLLRRINTYKNHYDVDEQMASNIYFESHFFGIPDVLGLDNYDQILKFDDEVKGFLENLFELQSFEGTKIRYSNNEDFFSELSNQALWEFLKS